MESKIIKNIIPASLTLIIIVIGYFAAQFIANNITSGSEKAAPATSKKSVYEVDKQAYESIANPNSASVNISLDESGFGRENPFAPYK